VYLLWRGCIGEFGASIPEQDAKLDLVPVVDEPDEVPASDW